MKKIPLTQGQYAIIDDEDYGKISKFKWFANRIGGKFYAVSSVRSNGIFRTVLMHRVVTGNRKGKEIDHLNGDGLDNRKENLRACSKAENMANRGAQKNNKSGFKGVSWVASRKKWLAQICSNKKHLNLGRFSAKEEAAKAYDEAAKKLHGEFARLNFA